MGVYTSAILALGKDFTSTNQAERFLREHGHLSDVTGDEIDDHGLETWVPDGLIFQNLDMYSGGYYYLGINLRGGTVGAFREQLDRATAFWKNMFPNVEPTVICAVSYS